MRVLYYASKMFVLLPFPQMSTDLDEIWQPWVFFAWNALVGSI